jgi:hypothetical protein
MAGTRRSTSGSRTWYPGGSLRGHPHLAAIRNPVAGGSGIAVSFDVIGSVGGRG